VITGDSVVDEIAFAVSVFDEDSENVGVETGNKLSTSIGFSPLVTGSELVAFLVSHRSLLRRYRETRCLSKNDDGDDERIDVDTETRPLASPG
jgi:hypothetical protein